MTSQRISIFPLAGAILLPGLHLPLHIFEPRYRAMISDSLARDRMIGMIQPRGAGDPPPLFDIGCLGRIADVEALEDGRYNILLEGVARFRVLGERDVTTLFRQVDGQLLPERPDDVLASIERAALEAEAKHLAARLGYQVDWDGVARLDDATFVNAIAQVAPFDVAAKQALLEANTLSERADLAIQLMQFFGSRDPGEDRATLQ